MDSETRALVAGHGIGSGCCVLLVSSVNSNYSTWQQECTCVGT